MKKFRFALQLALPVLGFVMSASVALAQSTAGQTRTSAQTSTTAESVRLYMQMHAVLSHPRCVNCHPRDDTPKQGLDQHVHSPPITRGPQDRGPLGLSCAACHNDANYDPSRVPGAPNWHLAPASMAWEGKSAGELCRVLTDRSKNGNRNLDKNLKKANQGWGGGVELRWRKHRGNLPPYGCACSIGLYFLGLRWGRAAGLFVFCWVSAGSGRAF